MTGPQGKPKGDNKNRDRVQRLRQRRKAQGWQPFDLWLSPDDAGLLTEIKQPGEPLHELIGHALRALRTLRAQGDSGLRYEERKAALQERIRVMYEVEKLTHQQIADRFNAAHEPTLSHRGDWQSGSVGRLLKTYPRGTL